MCGSLIAMYDKAEFGGETRKLVFQFIADTKGDRTVPQTMTEFRAKCKQYKTLVSNIIEKQNNTVKKFMGDW